jgi:DNA-binding FadR family transcriptional regulator
LYDNRTIEHASAALDAVRAAFERGDDGVTEGLAFHRAIAQATNNSKYVDLTEFLERYVRHQIQTTGGKIARASRMGQTQTLDLPYRIQQ